MNKRMARKAEKNNLALDLTWLHVHDNMSTC